MMEAAVPVQPRQRPGAALLLLLVASLLLWAVFTAHRPDTEEATRGVREVVQMQLMAFQADDAPKAFQLSDPGVRSRFGSADAFLAMVRAQYPMVHRPASVLFMKPQTDGHMAFQKIRMTDAAGTAWLVTYLLNRQKDDTWLISACLVVPDTPRVTA